MNPEALLGMLAELERIRELTLNLIERENPRLHPAPPDEAGETERTVFHLLLGARRAVLGNPAAARGLHDLLVAEGRRYANTPDGARLRDALAASARPDRWAPGVTASGLTGSPLIPISRTAARLKKPQRWQTMPHNAALRSTAR